MEQSASDIHRSFSVSRIDRNRVIQDIECNTYGIPVDKNTSVKQDIEFSMYETPTMIKSEFTSSDESTEIKPDINLLESQIIKQEVVEENNQYDPNNYNEVILKEEIKAHYSDDDSVGENEQDDTENESYNVIETTNQVLLCKLCNEQFFLSEAFKQHLKTHIGTFPYKCPLCDKMLASRYGLHMHLCIHCGIKPFKCEICQRKYSQRSHLKRHLREHEGNKPYACDECGRRFCENWALKHHKLLHSNILACDICDKPFTNKSKLTEHSVTHCEIRPFACTMCNKAFKLKRTLTQHTKRHLKSHSCDICEESFRTYRQLMTHQRSHAKMEELKLTLDKRRVVAETEAKTPKQKEKFECETCSKTFHTNNALKVHIQIHTGLKPYMCDSCGKTFRTNLMLKVSFSA